MSEALLAIDDLVVEFGKGPTKVRAVDRMTFAIQPGETLAIVGESGCGKSVTALSILKLLPQPSRNIAAGTIRFSGRDITTLGERGMRALRGRDIAMIFQEPMTSLNPVLTIGEQIEETVRLHEGVSRTDARRRALEMLQLVQIPDADRRLDQYPHELSGGMRQRAMIAMALSCGPRLLIADEPTTALDVTIQAQILDILRGLAGRSGMATLLITHDLGVVAEVAARVVVMYAGRRVEEGPVDAVLTRPGHPYTRGLLGAVPKLGSSLRHAARRRLAEIPGTVPLVRAPATACSFAPRCPLAVDQCRQSLPPPVPVGDAHVAACWRTADVASMVMEHETA